MHNFNFFAEKPGSSYKKSDSLLIIMILLLWGIGIVTLYFCSQGFAERVFGNSFYFVKRQLVSSLIGFVLMIFFAVVDMRFIRRIIPGIVFISIFLCILTFIPEIGIERNGARRWIKVPFFSTFQPSEAIKIAIVLFLANYFDKQENLPEDEKNVAKAVGFLVIFVGIIFAQNDFSTGFFVLLLGLIIFFVSGAKLSYFIPLTFLAIPIASLFILLKPYRVNRILGFLAPNEFQDTFNYQLRNAKRAIENGGFWGQGMGSGLSKISAVPEIQSDYIFVGWTEAMGFFGVLLYFCMLFYFGWRIFKISMNCGDRFASIATFGFGSSIIIQSLVNIAVVGGVLPSTGIPLPFFSSGGSSIICTLIMCGFMINASRIEKNDEFDFLIKESF